MVGDRDETHVALFVVGDLPCCLNLLAVAFFASEFAIQSMGCFESRTKVALLHSSTALLVLDQKQALARSCCMNLSESHKSQESSCVDIRLLQTRLLPKREGRGEERRASGWCSPCLCVPRPSRSSFACRSKSHTGAWHLADGTPWRRPPCNPGMPGQAHAPINQDYCEQKAFRI